MSSLIIMLLVPCSGKWGAGYLLVLRFIGFIKILWQKLQLQASSLIVSSQNGHNFVLV